MRLLAALSALFLLSCQPAPRAAEPTLDAVLAADIAQADRAPANRIDPAVIKLQVLLDRARASPGVIDGIDGDNVRKAVRAFREMRGLPAGDRLDEAAVFALSDGARPVLQRYRITERDLEQPFAPDLPSDYAELARRRDIPFRTPREMFGERFHMDEDLLAALNPGVSFDRPGTEIVVADLGGPQRERPRVERIVVERGMLRAFDAEGRLVAFYPATVGSRENPSPTGTHRVTRIARNPAYYYNPELNFVQGNNRERLRLPPGPNGPVGNIWIALDAPTYGIHGTPEPSRIDKAASHGCVRLTNWDAQALARMVRPGVEVEFRP